MASRHRPPPIPAVNSIVRGNVARIEEYGAFVQIKDFRSRGLVHRSQLARMRVERVEDAVSADDAVWVKVLSVEEGADENSGRTRIRMGLSLKYASQDGDEGGGEGPGSRRDRIRGRGGEEGGGGADVETPTERRGEVSLPPELPQEPWSAISTPASAWGSPSILWPP